MFFSSILSNSPDLCNCNKISQPPMNSPSTKTWGIVGQFENSFIPKKYKKELMISIQFNTDAIFLD